MKIKEEWWIETEKCPSDIYLKAGRRLLGKFNKGRIYPWQEKEFGLMRMIARNFPEKCLKIPYKREFRHFRIVPDNIMRKALKRFRKRYRRLKP